MAIVIGTAALILVLSVFNGFEGLVKSLYSSFYPDLKITPASGKEMVLTKEQVARLKSITDIKAVSLVVEEKAMLINGEFQANAYVKGVDDEYNNVAGVQHHIVKGAFDVGDTTNPKLVLGSGIENALGVQSDRSIAPITLYTGRKGAVDLQNPLNSVSSGLANTAGTFNIQPDFDNRYVLTNIHFIKQLLGMPEDRYSGAEISIQQDADPEIIKTALDQVLGKNYTVQTRYQQNASLYGIMRMEKWVIYAILSLILVVAAFNMIGALTMLVLEKKNDISVLHALGGDQAFIQKIFLSEGLLLAVIGGTAGMVIALVLALLQIHYKLIPLQGGSFLINYFPVQLHVADFILVGVTILVIALLASWVPARKAAHQQFLLREE